MRPLLALLLASSATLAPAPAQAQPVDLAAVREQLAAMQAEIARLTAQVTELKAREEARDVVPAAPPADETTISWKGAPEITSEDGWSFKPRGRLQVDAGIVSVPDSTGRSEGFGSEMRRARLGVEGRLPGGFGYKFEVDVAGNEVEVTDAIITYADGDLQVSAGQHNPFQSLEISRIGQPLH